MKRGAMIHMNKLIIIPIILLAASILYLGMLIINDSLLLDVDLRGGTQISIEFENQISSSDIEGILSEYGAKVRVLRGIGTYTASIDVSVETDTTEIIETLRKSGYSFSDWSQRTIGPALGASFFSQAQLALLIAFIAMALTVFIIFRILMPSLYVILAAAADIIETLALSQLLGIELSLATFAALLLLLGYSVDTDILLTTRVIKTEGNLNRKVKGAMKTGLTMAGTTGTALIVLYFISGSGTIAQIASILVIGLVFDVINTWLLNAELLKWYVSGKEK